MPVSELILLHGEIPLMIFVRSMELLSVILFFITIQIIHAHSSRSLGAYKYYLYQIVAWPFVSHLCTLMVPVFALPIIGAYHYIDFTDNPAVIHGILCAWIMVVAFDVLSIMDGLNFRFQVLLHTFHPTFAYKPFWIGSIMFIKFSVIVFVGGWIAPNGQDLDRKVMRAFLLQNYPNAVVTFDSYQSFVVYDLKRVPDFGIILVMISANTALVFLYGIFVILVMFKLLHFHRSQMSFVTHRLHARFISQLSLQAAVPFVVLLCPLFALTTIILSGYQLQSNLAGYAIIAFLVVHAPLTSLMTISLHNVYREVVINFFKTRIRCSRRITTSVSSSNFVRVKQR